VALSDNTLEYRDALWHCFVTATTVGYGDVGLPTQKMRAWAIVHVLFSVSWLAGLLQRVQAERTLRMRIIQRRALIKSQLDEKLIDRLDQDSTGRIDMVEFVGGMLVCFGVELCGERLSFENDIKPLIDRFRALDADSSGELDADDIRFMVAEARRKHGGAPPKEVKEPTWIQKWMKAISDEFEINGQGPKHRRKRHRSPSTAKVSPSQAAAAERNSRLAEQAAGT